MEESEVFDENNIICPPKQQQAYKKIRVLGEGSMGKAYLVVSKQDNQYYVMKRINIGHLSLEQQQLAMREAQLHALVQHPNIITFKEIYHTTKDKLCIIMEYAQNGDLDKVVQQLNGKSMSQDLVLQYFAQICMGLREIHSKKIIHRDIKGANVFITKDKVVKIGDFGISKSIDQTLQASKSFVGTPYYLSPQMVQGKPYSMKADIWSLGVLLYHMCAQKLPFQAQSLPLLALKILRGAFPPISGPYTRQLKNLILSMLQVDSNKRPTINQILLKPLLSKYLPKQQLQKIQPPVLEKSNVRKTPTPPPSITNQIITGVGMTLTHQTKVKKKMSKNKNDDDKQAKQQRKRKRNEERGEMKNDIRKKRLQIAHKEKVGSAKTIQTNNLNTQNTPKTIKQLTKHTSMSQNPQKLDEQQQKQPIQKPWKIKNKIHQKKDIQIQMHLPTFKNKQIKKQILILPTQMDYSFIQIRQFGKKNTPPTQKTLIEDNKQNNQSQENDQNGRKNNQNYDQEQQNQQNNQNKQNIHEQNHRQQSQQQQQQAVQGLYNYKQMLAHLTKAQQSIKNLNLKPIKAIQLYQQSQHFQDDTQKTRSPPSTPLPSKQANTFQQNRIKSINSIDSNNNTQKLQQGRQLVQQALGEQKFLKAYKILKQHHQYSQQHKLKGKQLDNYTFNKKILKNKLAFLTDNQFQDYIVWMYTLILMQTEQMKKNFQ